MARRAGNVGGGGPAPTAHRRSGGEQHLIAMLTGFLDTDVQSGSRYFYRIRAVYISSTGERLASPGTVCVAVT